MTLASGTASLQDYVTVEPFHRGVKSAPPAETPGHFVVTYDRRLTGLQTQFLSTPALRNGTKKKRDKKKKKYFKIACILRVLRERGRELSLYIYLYKALIDG